MADQSDSKSSSDETDRSDQNDDLGSGRSYGCTFCKRGFTTAQALGGHMNIHRKDRGKPIKPDYTASHHHHHHNSLVSGKLVVTENYASFRSFLAIQSYPPVHFAGAPHDHQQVHLDYRQTYNHFNLTNSWVSPSVKPSQDHNDSRDYDPNYNDLLRGDWRSGSNLSLGIGMSQYEEEIDHHHHHRHQHDHDKIRGDHVEVDLELRLGYI